jgi:hypothetical protein
MKKEHESLLKKYNDPRIGFYWTIRYLIKKHPNGIKCKCEYCKKNNHFVDINKMIQNQ